jgi:phosphatidate phosphatase APP1
MSVLHPVAHRLVRTVRGGLTAVGRRRGWTHVVLPYICYGGHGQVRVLGRVQLSSPDQGPHDRRGVGGWRRFFTLEQPDVEVQVRIAGSSTTVRSGEGGFIDQHWQLDVPPGTHEVTFVAEGRTSTSLVHVYDESARLGVVCDIDDTVMVTGLTNPLLAAWRTLTRASAGRESVPGTPELLRVFAEVHDGLPMIYLSNGAWNMVGPVLRFLERNGYPDGTPLMTNWGVTSERLFRDGKAHKRASLQQLAEELPDVRWVMVGDTGEHDPELYAAHVERSPDRVAAVALRDVDADGDFPDGDGDERHRSTTLGPVPLVQAPNGHGLLAGLRRTSVLPAAPGGA